MDTRGCAVLVGALLVLGLCSAPGAHGDEASGGIDLACRLAEGQRFVYRVTQTMHDDAGSKDEQSANTVGYDYYVGPVFIEGRVMLWGGVRLSGGTLPFTLLLSRGLDVGVVAPDSAMTEKDLVLFGRIYAPMFEQVFKFCGHHWTLGESRRIELPFSMDFAPDVTARFVRVGRRYGRRTAEFEVTASGPLTGARGEGEMTGSGTTWVDIETGVMLESVMRSVAVISGLERAPVMRFEVKEERRLDAQMTRF
jgi:hypothetical protein